MSPDLKDDEKIASAILRDMPAALGIAHLSAGQMAFDWLGEVHQDDVYSAPIDRLVNAWRAASAADQAQIRNGLSKAIDRTLATWLGAERSIALLDWQHEIAPEDMSTSRWLALLFHRNPNDAAETSYWIRQIVARLDRWQVNVRAMRPFADFFAEQELIALVQSCAERDRVALGCLLLAVLLERPANSRLVWDAVILPWKSKLPTLPAGYSDWIEDIVVPLSDAARNPSFAVDEYASAPATRERFLSGYANGAESWRADHLAHDDGPVIRKVAGVAAVSGPPKVPASAR